MFENLVASRLSAFLSAYVEGFDPSQIMTSVGVWNGRLDLRDVSIRRDALQALDIPIRIVSGRIRQLQVVVPWVNLTQAGATFILTGVELDLITDLAVARCDADQRQRHKQSALDEYDLLARRRRPGFDSGFLQKFLSSLLYNFHLELRDVRIRLTDLTVTTANEPVAFEFVLDSVTAQSTDANNAPALTAPTDAFAYKSIRLDGLRLSWLLGADRHDLVPPFSCTAAVRLTKAAEVPVGSDVSPGPPLPRLHIQVVMESVALHLIEKATRDFALVVGAIVAHRAKRAPRTADQFDAHLAQPHRPSVPIVGHARKWWQFAIRAWCDSRFGGRSWTRIRAFRALFRDYTALYGTELAQGPGDRARFARLQELESQLTLDQILMMRDVAEQQLQRRDSSAAHSVSATSAAVSMQKRRSLRSFVSGFLFSTSADTDINISETIAASANSASMVLTSDTSSNSADQTGSLNSKPGTIIAHCLFRFQIRSLHLYVLTGTTPYTPLVDAVLIGLCGDVKLLSNESFLNLTLLQCEARDVSCPTTSALFKIVDGGLVQDVDVAEIDFDEDQNRLLELRLQRSCARTDLVVASSPLTLVLSRAWFALIGAVCVTTPITSSSSPPSRSWCSLIPGISVDIDLGSLIVIIPNGNDENHGLRLSFGQASLANALDLDSDDPTCDPAHIAFDAHVLDLALHTWSFLETVPLDQSALDLDPVLDTIAHLSVVVDAAVPDSVVRSVSVRSSLPPIRLHCSDEQRYLLSSVLNNDNVLTELGQVESLGFGNCPKSSVTSELTPSFDLEIDCFSISARFWSCSDSADDAVLTVNAVQIRMQSDLDQVQYDLEFGDAVLENCRIAAVASEFSHWVSVRPGFGPETVASPALTLHWSSKYETNIVFQNLLVRICNLHLVCDIHTLGAFFEKLATSHWRFPEIAQPALPVQWQIQVDLLQTSLAFMMDRNRHCLFKSELFDIHYALDRRYRNRLSIDNLIVCDYGAASPELASVVGRTSSMEPMIRIELFPGEPSSGLVWAVAAQITALRFVLIPRFLSDLVSAFSMWSNMNTKHFSNHEQLVSGAGGDIRLSLIMVDPVLMIPYPNPDPGTNTTFFVASTARARIDTLLDDDVGAGYRFEMASVQARRAPDDSSFLSLIKWEDLVVDVISRHVSTKQTHIHSRLSPIVLNLGPAELGLCLWIISGLSSMQSRTVPESRQDAVTAVVPVNIAFVLDNLEVNLLHSLSGESSPFQTQPIIICLSINNLAGALTASTAKTQHGAVTASELRLSRTGADLIAVRTSSDIDSHNHPALAFEWCTVSAEFDHDTVSLHITEVLSALDPSPWLKLQTDLCNLFKESWSDFASNSTVFALTPATCRASKLIFGVDTLCCQLVDDSDNPDLTMVLSGTLTASVLLTDTIIPLLDHLDAAASNLSLLLQRNFNESADSVKRSGPGRPTSSTVVAPCEVRIVADGPVESGRYSCCVDVVELDCCLSVDDAICCWLIVRNAFNQTILAASEALDLAGPVQLPPAPPFVLSSSSAAAARTTTASTSTSMSLALSVNRMCIQLVDDRPSMFNAPVFRLVIQSLASQVEGSVHTGLRCNTKIGLCADVYHFALNEWEPLIEICSIRVDLRRSGANVNDLLVEVDRVLDVNLSDAVYINLRHSVETWNRLNRARVRGLASAARSARSDLQRHHVRIINKTGTLLRISTSSSDIQQIEPDHESDFFTQYDGDGDVLDLLCNRRQPRPAPARMLTVVLARGPPDSESGSTSPSGDWSPMRPIPLDGATLGEIRVHELRRAGLNGIAHRGTGGRLPVARASLDDLSQAAASAPAFILSTMISETELILSSPVLIRNHTPAHFCIRIQTGSETRFGQLFVRPGADAHIPIWALDPSLGHGTCLIRPFGSYTAEFATLFVLHELHQLPERLPSPRMVHCPGRSGLAGFSLSFRAWTRKMSAAAIGLILEPILSVINELPRPLHICLLEVDAQTQDNLQAIIEPGDTRHLHQATTQCRFRLTGANSPWSEPVTICNPDPDQQDRVVALDCGVPGSAPQPVKLEVVMVDHSCRLHVRVDYWFINRTGLDLFYGVLETSSATSHAFKPNCFRLCPGLDPSGLAGRARFNRAAASIRSLPVWADNAPWYAFPGPRRRQMETDNPDLGLVLLANQQTAPHLSWQPSCRELAPESCSHMFTSSPGALIGLRLGDSEWSSPVPIDSIVPMHVSFSSGRPHSSSGRVPIYRMFDLGVSGAVQASTTMVTIAPRYVMRNGTRRDLQYRQAGTTERVTLVPGAECAVHRYDGRLPPLFLFRLRQFGASWSGSIALDQVGTVALRLLNRYSPDLSSIIRIDCSLQDATFEVHVFEDAAGVQAPYRLENFTFLTLMFAQDGAGARSERVLPYHSTEFAWDEPMKSRKVVVHAVADGGQRSDDPHFQYIGTYSLDRLSSYPAVRLTGHDWAVLPHSREIRVDVVAIGAVRVLRVFDSMLDRTLKLASRPEPSYSFCVRLRLTALGLSFIDMPRGGRDAQYQAQRREIAYVRFGHVLVDVRRVQDQTGELRLRAASLQIDNPSLSAAYPVVLAPSALPAPLLAQGADPFLDVSLVKSLTQSNEEFQFYPHCSLSVRPFDLRLEESFLSDLSQYMQPAMRVVAGPLPGMWSPAVLNTAPAAAGTVRAPSPVRPGSRFRFKSVQEVALTRFYCQTLSISSLRIRVSFASAPVVHASAVNPFRVLARAAGASLANIEDVPVRLNAVHASDLFGTGTNLIIRLGHQYVVQMVREAYKLLAGADVLGNPIGLLTNLARGISDVVYLPLRGIFVSRSPTAFVAGVWLGGVSLIRHLLFGFGNASAKITSSIAKGIASMAVYDDDRFSRHRSLPGALLYGTWGLFAEPFRNRSSLIQIYRGCVRAWTGFLLLPLAAVFHMLAAGSDMLRALSDTRYRPARVRIPRQFDLGAVVRPYAFFPDAVRQFACSVLGNQRQYLVGHVGTYPAFIVVTSETIFAINASRNAPNGLPAEILTQVAIRSVFSMTIGEAPHLLNLVMIDNLAPVVVLNASNEADARAVIRMFKCVRRRQRRLRQLQ